MSTPPDKPEGDEPDNVEPFPPPPPRPIPPEVQEFMDHFDAIRLACLERLKVATTDEEMIEAMKFTMRALNEVIDPVPEDKDPGEKSP
jgi:hypothetical protein